MYPCYRCNGAGRIQHFAHVLSGVCFKCRGTGTQASKPARSVRWAVIDAKDRHMYNVSAPTATRAVKRALVIFQGAKAEFKTQFDTTLVQAVPADEYWAAKGARE